MQYEKRVQHYSVACRYNHLLEKKNFLLNSISILITTQLITNVCKVLKISLQKPLLKAMVLFPKRSDLKLTVSLQLIGDVCRADEHSPPVSKQLLLGCLEAETFLLYSTLPFRLSQYSLPINNPKASYFKHQVIHFFAGSHTTISGFPLNI